ncbi:putative quinol monooxygenase [Spirosoma humi]
MNIHLTAIIKSKPEHTEEIKSVLQNLVVQSRKETACLQYDLHQSTASSNIFIFHEIWEDESGLARHNEQPYLKAFGEIVDEKLQEKPAIYVTEPI